MLVKMTMLKRKQYASESSASSQEDSDTDSYGLDHISERLKAHGEEFLRSFDGEDNEEGESAGRSSRSKMRKVEMDGKGSTATGGASANTIDEWFAMMGHGSAPAIAKTVAQPSRQVMVVDATKYGEHPHSKPKSERAGERDGNAMQPGPTGRRKKPKETFKERLAREVEELGAQMLTGKEKKEYEARKIMRLGGKAPKNPKVPLKILMGMRKKESERAQKKQQEAILTGMHVKKKKRTKPVKGSKGLDLYSQTGTFKGGVLKIKPSLMKSGKSKKSR